AGTTRGPLWRTGGRAFAARPRNYEQKVNRKMYRGAIRSILSELIRQDRMKVVDDILVDVVKTKALALRLATHGAGSTLLISNDVSEQLYLSVRNLRQVGLSEVETIDPALLISFDKVLISQAAIQSLQERLS
ncbi:MAG: 50S ribosomal protein L4, partial [Gammaproteobacteria bacterium]|nr:50S ribosomal protein L4 [Gammaproteobacteria bacterium]